VSILNNLLGQCMRDAWVIDLVAVVEGRADRRSREIRLTDTGAERPAPRSKAG
jgi:hypothetical protein